MIGQAIKPVLVFDSREKWFPCAVEASISRFPVNRLSNPLALNFPNGAKHPDIPVVSYYRAVAGDSLIWHQFWFWYIYNPGPPALHGVGRHEGDWEFVQIGTVADVPVLVTASQHKTGGKREFWACQLEGLRPVIYVGLGSHAMFFQPGSDGIDVCNAGGMKVDEYPLRKFHDWAGYDGRWGNSENSPRSPAKQGDRWHHPHLYHSSAR